MKCITAVTSTICRLMDIVPPNLARTDEVLDEVVKAAPGRLQKCLVYAPDAIGTSLLRSHPDLRARVQRRAPVAVALRAVFPPKTPVCFASMFSGGDPEAHGVRWPDRPVLRCDTIFDALVRAGKKVAIAAVTNCSIDRLFRERPIEYHPEVYDAEVMDRALELLARDDLDVLIVYHQEYDDLLHETGCRSPESLAALEHHVASFERLAQAAAQYWSKYAWGIWFAPDHGGHDDPATKKGTHGDDTPEDMEVDHFVGFGKNQR